MARILVVDDRALNRDYLLTLLGYHGHTLVQASDGEEALEIVRRAPPDLIITDIAMPRMTGVEFIEQIQRDPASAAIPVIFHSAIYLVPEARAMAHACHAAAVIPKPSEPEVIIRAVQSALGELPASPMQPTPSPPPPSQGWNPSLVALMELQCAIAEVSDTGKVLELVCRAAPDLIAAQYAVLGLEDTETGALTRVLACGLDASATFAEGARVGAAFALRLAEPGGHRAWGPEMDNLALGLPAAHPPVQSLLVMPLDGTRARYGWIYLANRNDGAPFTAADEELLGLLARQAAIAYEHDAFAMRAARDALTGLLNRGELNAALKRECQRARRQGSPLALVMIDIDHFKQCNDQYGHAAGDAVLREVAAELGKMLRGYDQVFRYGGEEFVMLLPGATAAHALSRAEQCRHSIKRLELSYDGQAIGPVTISLGVASYPGQTEDTLLRAADQALYQAKHAGRDRSCLAPAIDHQGEN